jgi:hypothetical protein
VSKGRAVQPMESRTARPSILTCSGQGLRKLVDTLHAGDRMVLRRELIFAAGAANNRKLLDGLGSMERSNWYEGRRAADPDFVNPYWPDR